MGVGVGGKCLKRLVSHFNLEIDLCLDGQYRRLVCGVFWRLILKFKSNHLKSVSVYYTESPFRAGKMYVVGTSTHFVYFVYCVKQ